MATLARYCGDKGYAVADECELAINVLKKTSRRNAKVKSICLDCPDKEQCWRYEGSQTKTEGYECIITKCDFKR